MTSPVNPTRERESLGRNFEAPPRAVYTSVYE